MAGTKEGGTRAAETNKRRYGADFYARIGAKGGKAPKSTYGGFAVMARQDPERHKRISREGGMRSRRLRQEEGGE